jgi:hypothetical protein
MVVVVKLLSRTSKPPTKSCKSSLTREYKSDMSFSSPLSPSILQVAVTTFLMVWWIVVSHLATPTVLATTIPSQIFHARIPCLVGYPTSTGQQQLWMYQGALYDPLDGRQICQVQGLEMVRPVYNTSHLAIDAILRAANATYEDVKSLWSQKIFCYTTTSSDRTRQELLTTVRLRPQAPLKRVPVNQAVMVYETATSFVSRGNEDQPELLIHSEFPNGKTMWGKAAFSTGSGGSVVSSPLQNQQNQPPMSSSSTDFTVYTKLRSPKSPLHAPDLSETTTSLQTGSEQGLVVSPKRAALVQFGSASGTMETKHKFGARETYSYRNIPPAVQSTTEKKHPMWMMTSLAVWGTRRRNEPTTPVTTTLSYSRYGEGPPFYAPGRMCMLELSARPIASVADATPVLQSLLQHNGGPVQNFGGTSVISIQQAWGLGLHRGKARYGKGNKAAATSSTQRVLHLDNDAIQRDSTRMRLPTWVNKGQAKLEELWERISTSTTMETAV